MSEPFVFLGNMPKPTPEEWAATEKIIEKAKAVGHPWAFVAGSLPDDEVTEMWIDEMRAARQRAEEDPNF